MEGMSSVGDEFRASETLSPTRNGQNNYYCITYDVTFDWQQIRRWSCIPLLKRRVDNSGPQQGGGAENQRKYSLVYYTFLHTDYLEVWNPNPTIITSHNLYLVLGERWARGMDARVPTITTASQKFGRQRDRTMGSMPVGHASHTRLACSRRIYVVYI